MAFSILFKWCMRWCIRNEWSKNSWSYTKARILLKDRPMVTNIMINTDTMTRMSGKIEKVAAPLLIWRLMMQNLNPETMIMIPAKAKQNRLKKNPSLTWLGDSLTPVSAIRCLMNSSNFSITKPNASKDMLVRDHDRKVRSFAIWVLCHARRVLSSEAMSGGLLSAPRE